MSPRCRMWLCSTPTDREFNDDEMLRGAWFCDVDWSGWRSKFFRRHWYCQALKPTFSEIIGVKPYNLGSVQL